MDYYSHFSLLLPGLSKLPSQCYSNALGSWGNLSSNLPGAAIKKLSLYWWFSLETWILTTLFIWPLFEVDNILHLTVLCNIQRLGIQILLVLNLGCLDLLSKWDFSLNPDLHHLEDSPHHPFVGWHYIELWQYHAHAMNVCEYGTSTYIHGWTHIDTLVLQLSAGKSLLPMARPC